MSWKGSMIKAGISSDGSNLEIFRGTLTMNSNRKLQFRDSGCYIHSNADGYLTIEADIGVVIAADFSFTGTLTVGTATTGIAFTGAYTDAIVISGTSGDNAIEITGVATGAGMLIDYTLPGADSRAIHIDKDTAATSGNHECFVLAHTNSANGIVNFRAFTSDLTLGANCSGPYAGYFRTDIVDYTVAGLSAALGIELVLSSVAGVNGEAHGMTIDVALPDGASSPGGASSKHSFIKVETWGDGKANWDSYANLFYINGPASGAGKLVSADEQTLRINIEGTSRYLVLSTTENCLVFEGTLTKGIDFTSATMTASADNSFISCGTYTSAKTVLGTATYIPIQVNLSSTGNMTTVGHQVAAARFRVDNDTNSQPNTAVNVLQLRSDISQSCYFASCLNASLNISADITMGGGTVQGIYVAINGNKTITTAETVSVIEARHGISAGGGVTNVIWAYNLGAASITNIIELTNVGTATNGILIGGAGTMTTGISITQACTTGISITGACSTAAIAVTGGLITQVHTETSATPGTVRATYIKHVTYSTNTTATLVGVRGEMNLPDSATTGAGTYLCGVQGKLVCAGSNTIASTNGHVCGVYGQIDISAATTTSGHIACLIASVQDSTGQGTDRTFVDGIYVETPSKLEAVNSILKGYGAVTTYLDFANVYGVNLITFPIVAANSPYSSANSGGTQAGKITIKVGDSTRYIQVYSN